MILEIIPKVMEMTQRESGKYYPRPSASGVEKCIRQQVYDALGFPPDPFPGRAIETMDDSSWHEELTADRLAKTTYKLHSRQMAIEIPFKSDFLKGFHCKMCNKDILPNTLHGHIDGILTDMAEQDYLFEHKAISHFSFQTYETGDLLPYDYISQCVIYILGIEKITSKFLPAILFMKNKNTSQYLEYHIEYDPQSDIAKCKLFVMEYDDNKEGYAKEKKEFFVEDVRQKAFHRWEEIEKYARIKTLPPRQYDIESWRCSYCRWGKKCYENYSEEIDNRQEIKITDKEIIKFASEYVLLNTDIKEKTKKVDEIKEVIKLWMMDKNAKRGLTDGIIISLTKTERKTLDKNKIPPEIILQATKKTLTEMLRIKKVGDKEVEQ